MNGPPSGTDQSEQYGVHPGCRSWRGRSVVVPRRLGSSCVRETWVQLKGAVPSAQSRENKGSIKPSLGRRGLAFQGA